MVILIGGILFGINRYNLCKYHQTSEYKLLEVGYDEKTVKAIEKNLEKSQIDYLISSDKIDYILDLMNEKYFLKKNFNEYLTFYEENGKYSFKDVVAIVNVGANKEWYSETVNSDTSKGNMILANKFNLLPEDYDAGTIKNFSQTYAYGEVSAKEECYFAFIEMATSAKKDNITLIVTSGYRTQARQKAIYDDMLKSRGQTYADSYAARPGASEHETGLALDVFTPGATTDSFANTEAYAWLSNHAIEYGFILRYPDEKQYLTGYSPESWHYRYVGIDIAKKISEEGITFDEYYAYYIANE